MVPVKVIFVPPEDMHTDFKGTNPLDIEFPTELLAKPSIGDHIIGFDSEGGLQGVFVVGSVEHAYTDLEDGSGYSEEPILKVFVYYDHPDYIVKRPHEIHYKEPDAQDVLERIKGHLEDFQKWYEGDGYVYFELPKRQGETLLKIAKEVAFAGGKLWG